MSGSAVEPSAHNAAHHAHQAAEQMRAATERLRDKAWMVTAVTKPETLDSADHAEIAPTAEV